MNRRALLAIIAPVLLHSATPPARAQDAIDRLDMKAHAAFEARDYPTAIKLWGEVVKLDPSDTTAWSNLGKANDFTGKKEQAIAAYSEVIRLDPKDADAYTERGVLYRDRHDARAIDDFNTLLALKPDMDSYLTRAYGYRLLGQPAKAIADYNTAFRLFPPDDGDYLVRGEAYAEAEEWDKSIADYNKAIQMEAQNPEPWSYEERAGVYAKMGDYQKAIADYTTAIDLPDPDLLSHVSLITQRAHAWACADNPDKAIDDYNFAMAELLKGNDQGATDYTLCLVGRGDMYAREGQYEKAIADYHSAMSQNSSDTSAYDSLALLLATSPDPKYRDPAKAASLALQACEITKWQYDYRAPAALAAAEAAAGKWPDAVKHQKQAITLLYNITHDKKEQDALATQLANYQQQKPYQPAPAPAPPQ